MKFTKESIQQGRANQDASVETPETFATIEGAAQPREGTELSRPIAVWLEPWVHVLWN